MADEQTYDRPDRKVAPEEGTQGFGGTLSEVRAAVESGPDGSSPSDAADEDAILWAVSTRDVASMTCGPESSADLARDRRHKARVAQWVSDHCAELPGTADEWHDLVNVFYNDRKSALLVAEAGRKRFPNDAILLSDAIWCAASLGDWKTGDKLLKLAEEEGFCARENWSLALSVADYLRAKACTQGAKERAATYGRALEFVRGAEKRISATDRLVNCEARILLDAGNTAAARRVLEKAIFMEDFIGSKRNLKRLPMPQCCLTYLQTILAQSCDYETIIRVCDAGIRFAAMPTDSTKNGHFAGAKVGYFLFRRAEAMDSRMLVDAEGKGSKGFNPVRVRGTLRTYSLAYKLGPCTAYSWICRDRFMILCGLAEIDDMDVDEYCPLQVKDDE